ncbi:hypothetical protein [Stappia sp. 28M-7]|jgi:hypothetical protein|uniref:hypothetical protein n=1 Tax=Stappia sp. 28M-7 TaxID=2762596 RepID=UPI00163B8556|nr:hypothetical protein [Stappia sp. 28M-7]MBC2860353.1 hypothetical protein [Stappia sp. 28M-7]
MTTRTTQSIVRFQTAFLLPDFVEPQPPGDYQVDRDEELIEGLSWIAWKRVGTFIHLPAIGVRTAIRQLVPIDPAQIDAVTEKENQR